MATDTTGQTFAYPSSYEAWEDFKQSASGDDAGTAFKVGFVCGRMGYSPELATKPFLARLWQRIRYYPWRSHDDLVRWREGNWWPWSGNDWIKDWRGYRLRKLHE